MKTGEVVSGIQGAWESVSTTLALVFSFTYRVGVEPWDLRGICSLVYCRSVSFACIRFGEDMCLGGLRTGPGWLNSQASRGQDDMKSPS